MAGTSMGAGGMTTVWRLRVRIPVPEVDDEVEVGVEVPEEELLTKKGTKRQIAPRHFGPCDGRLDGEPDGLHGHEAAAVVPGDAERRELLFQGRALVNLRRAVVWGQVEHRLHE